MKQSQLAFILLAAASLLIPASTFAQAKLHIKEQQARSKEVQVSAEELSWTIQVRDICTTQVKKEEIRMPCSEWRPLLPTDVERTPFFKGEVTLADGKVQKLLGRRGPSSSGEQHRVSALLRTVAPPAVPQVELQHDSETAGLWKADTAVLGGVLLRMSENPDGPWTISLKGKVEAASLRWRDQEKEHDYPLSAEQITAHRDDWRCVALDDWTTGEDLLEQKSWEVDGGPLPLGHLTAQIDELGEFCPKPTKEARRQVCELTAETISGIEADQESVDLERVQLLLDFCPGQGSEKIAESLKAQADGMIEELQVVALRSYTSRWEPILGDPWKSGALERLSSGVESGFAALEKSEVIQGMTLFIEQHSEALGPEWTTGVEGRRTAVVQSLLDRAVTARDVGAITAVINDHKDVMSEEWATSATERRTGVISSYLDEAVASKEVPKITEVIETHRKLVDDAWLTDAQAQRTRVISCLL